MVRIYTLALLCAAVLSLAACGAATLSGARGSAVAGGGGGKGKPPPELTCTVTADATEFGVPARVRFTATPDDPTVEVASFQFGIGRGISSPTGLSHGRTAEVYIPFEKPGEYDVTARGVDANG